MTLRPVNNPAAGGAQRTRTGRHFSGMTRRDLAFVHLHRPVKAAYLKAIVRAALEHDPGKADTGFLQHRTFPEFIFVPASAGVIIQTRTSRRGRTRLRSPSRQPR
jgi:hypothetical protein